MVVPDDVELKLMLGAIKSMSESFHVYQKTIRKIWQRALKSFNNPDIESFTSSPKKKETPVNSSYARLVSVYFHVSRNIVWMNPQLSTI
jgi:hypothetical protein